MRLGGAAPHRLRLGRLAVQFGVAFAVAMVAVGLAGFSLADNWVSSRIDASLRYHTEKYLRDVQRSPDEDALLGAKILEWQHRKVLSERTYVLFNHAGARIAGRLDIAPPPAGYSNVKFTGGGHSFQIGRALATRLSSGGLFVVIQHSEAAEGLHALLPLVVLTTSLVALLLGLSATFLFAHLIAKRLMATQSTAAAIAGGDLGRRVPMERLDGMFAVQAESLNKMLDHMADLVQSQQLFSSNLAHDLRTPLTRLQGMLEQAARGDQQTFTASLGRAERECAAIIDIFDALLRLAEIEMGCHPAALDAVPLRPLVEDIAETMEPVIADRGGALDLGRMDDVVITGDEDLINQLLVNLIENVANHTPPGTRAVVSLERRGSRAVITISDDGPGLPREDVTRVIQPFERGAFSSTSGSGLGLAIANAIVRFHQGSLELVDANPGLQVRISLPANAPSLTVRTPALASC